MLNLTNIALRRGPHLLFENVDLTFYPGDRAGIVGANGCGKSSLFALILGELEADAGEMHLAGDPVIAHVAQETPAGRRPAIEYVIDGDAELRRIQQALVQAEADGDGHRLANLYGRLESIGGYSAEARAGRLMSGLGFEPEQESLPVGELSGGWRMRLNLAQALMCRSDLLLLDEPTNHLDLDAVIWLQNWLLGYQGTLLLISHDRDFLDRVTTRIVHMERGRVYAYSGNYAAFERQRAERLQQQQAAYEKQQTEIEHIRKFINRFRAQANKAKQAQSRIKALERMELITPVDPEHAFRFEFLPPVKLPSPLLKMDGAECGYPGVPVLNDVDLNILPGDRIGLLGRNGAGKSTLVKSLAGKLPLRAGERVGAQELRIGFFEQHQLQQLDPGASPLLHMQRLDKSAREQSLRNFLGQFGFRGEMALAPVAPFSGGERARLVLAMLVYQRPNLLLLDEPTNHLDLDMRDALAFALQDYTGALVVIAHDRHLLRSTTDQLILVSNGRVQPFDGDLDDYARWLMANSGDTAAAAEPAASGSISSAGRKEQRRREAEQRQALHSLRKQVSKLEQRLESLQRQQADIEQELAGLYATGDRSELEAMLRKQAETRQERSRVEEEWFEALAQLESARIGPAVA
ncbi:MAG: ATP-binding cassette domain-containing protein, partial [Gammaproteobacteria bacterium]